jgi:uncharacterized protein YcaQ
LNHLSQKQARKLVLARQGIHRETEFGAGYQGVVNAIERLSYVQIDTISVVERAHHHALWNRLKEYSPRLLNQAVAERGVFEYWSHAAAYLPMRDLRFSLPRKHGYLNGDQHWYHKNPKQMQYVKDRITAEGELRVKDFDQQRSQSDHAWGGHKPAKMALEQLFMQGELMVSRRDGFQKVFDLSERVIPDDVDSSMPTETEHLDHLIMRFLSSNGIGSSAEIAYLRKGFKPLVEKRCKELIEEQRIAELVVAGKRYFALSDFATALNKNVSRLRVKILSPFDNLLIQRQRMRDLFDFDYQIECYVTAKKRKHGYFVLPILAGQQFIGRMDAKIDRKTKRMTVSKLFLETNNYSEHRQALVLALKRFLEFNQGVTLIIEQVIIDHKVCSASDVNLIFDSNEGS